MHLTDGVSTKSLGAESWGQRLGAGGGVGGWMGRLVGRSFQTPESSSPGSAGGHVLQMTSSNELGVRP